ncbi:MAG TPA: tripartite tricarboxylate transporter substrate binding protein [Hydrogenophaga sp.]
MKNRSFRNALATGFLALSALSSHAQAFPTKPITVVVGFGAGGGTDTAARLMAKDLAEELGQPVVVENRAGAGGSIGAGAVAKAPADGYTLFFGSGSELTVLPALKPNLPYNTLKDFAPVTEVGTVGFMMVAHPSVKANTLPELIALAKKQPGELTFASYGVGSTNHLIGELFQAKTQTKLLHVPYKGSAAAATDLMSGQVQIAFDTVSVMAPNVEAGKLKGLAVLSAKRSDRVPELPTMAESGVNDLVVVGWLGVLAPAGTPAPIVDRLNKAISAVLKHPNIVETLKGRGVQVTGQGPDQFRDFIASEAERWRGVVKAANLKID